MDSYQFTPTQDWVSPNIDNWTALFPLVQSKQPRVLEIGSWEGRSAVFLLNTLCKDGGELTCIDHFDLLKTDAGRKRFDRINHNLALTGKQFRVIPRFSVPALKTVLKEEMTCKNPGFDWIYVDESHEADDTILDGELVWCLARKGAIIIFDDYCWDREQEDSIHQPKRGINTFLALHAGEYQRLPQGKNQVVLRKLTDMGIEFPVGSTGDQHPLDIALCFNSLFALAGAVVIRSLLEITPEPLTIYIVDCGILPEDIENLKQTINGYDQATLVFLPRPNEAIGPAWTRLDMMDILPVERILYLDADTLVRKGLKTLWDVDLGGECLAAAPAIEFPMGLDETHRSPYFNSGVVLMDVAKARFDMRELRKLASQMKNAKYKDQDVCPSEDWEKLTMEDILDPSVVHFTGLVHPSMGPNVQPPLAKPWGFAWSSI